METTIIIKRIVFWIIIASTIISGVVISWNTYAYRDIETLKQGSPGHLISLGFNVIGYNGYHGGIIYGGSVFYLANRMDYPAVIYEVELVEWRGEIQSYMPIVVNSNIVIH